MNILLIEDDATIASFVIKGFEQEGFSIELAQDGIQGLDAALGGHYDAIILDIMLPKLDGMRILELLRSEGNTTPVLVLSAKRSVRERVEGLQRGGDDYLVKPFHFSELLVRIENLVKRTSVVEGGENSKAALTYGELSLDPWRREVSRKGVMIALRSKEFSLLEYMMRHPQQVLSKTSILEHVYDYHFDPQTNVVDVLVCRLRNKIDKPFEVKYIHTLRGLGYILKIKE